MEKSKYTYSVILSELLLIAIVVLTCFGTVAGAEIPIEDRQAIIQLAKTDTVLLLERTKSRYQDDITDYPCGRLVMKIDIGYLLPVYAASYDWNGRLISKYVYTDLKFNTGLTERQFTRKANQL